LVRNQINMSQWGV